MFVPEVEGLVVAVMNRDIDLVKAQLDRVPSDVSAIVLAELLAVERRERAEERARIAGERDRFQLHYSRARKQVLELREILNRKVASVPAGTVRNRKVA